MKLELDSVASYKKYNCVFYEECLGHAARRNWPQFHCRDCKSYKPDQNQPPLDMSRVLSVLFEEE